MKALNGIGKPIVDQIKANRPYVSFKDFLKRCPVKKTAVVNLIKAGAFDNIEEGYNNFHSREIVMAYYLHLTSEPKKKLNLMNFNGLVNNHLVPSELSLEKKIFSFNKYLKSHKFKYPNDFRTYYYIPDIYSINFFLTNFGTEAIEKMEGEIPLIDIEEWDRIYQYYMDNVREWIKENQDTLLTQLNQQLFKSEWEKYAKGNISSWEMDALCFYSHSHELINVNKSLYGIVDFNNLPSVPTVDYYFKRNGVQIPIFKLYRIIGTVIGKNDTRSSITLLTTSGVVNVKFTRDYYAMFNRQISEVNQAGEKKVKEKGWFTRGTKLLINGFRRDDTFVAKKYKSTNGHQLYKILNVNNHKISLTSTRYGMEENNE